ncbi:MAG: acyltransferase family protein, partial [Pseudomonadota bacterium]
MKTNLIAIDYLRAFMTVLVLAVHSSLAYVNFAPSALHGFTDIPYMWVNYPVVDAQRWIGIDVYFLYTEHFLLGLMFLVAGLFIWPSIARKGRKGYLLGRLTRLGLPLVVVVALCSPLAYYPSYALRDSNPAVGDYLEQWLSLDFWSPGPCWFIAVLLIFDVVAVLLHRFLPGVIEGLGRFCSGAEHAPARFFMGLIGAAALVYVALCFYYGGTLWLTTPQYEQTSHALLFLLYFFAGMGMGAWGLERGLLAPKGHLVRRWQVG